MLVITDPYKFIWRAIDMCQIYKPDDGPSGPTGHFNGPSIIPHHNWRGNLNSLALAEQEFPPWRHPLQVRPVLPWT